MLGRGEGPGLEGTARLGPGAAGAEMSCGLSCRGRETWLAGQSGWGGGLGGRVGGPQIFISVRKVCWTCSVCGWRRARMVRLPSSRRAEVTDVGSTSSGSWHL